METPHKLSALAVTVMMALAASPIAAQPPRTPDDIIVPPGRSQPGPPKSDAYRIVGKVLRIDREQGQVALATEEGAVVVKPTPQLLGAIRVGDTISVPRAGEEAPSALPRQ